MYTYIFIIQASVYDTNKIIHSVNIVTTAMNKSKTISKVSILNNGQIFSHMTKTVRSFIVLRTGAVNPNVQLYNVHTVQ